MRQVSIGEEEFWSMHTYLYHLTMCKLVFDNVVNFELHTDLYYNMAYNMGTDSPYLFGALLEELYGTNYCHSSDEYDSDKFIELLKELLPPEVSKEVIEENEKPKSSTYLFLYHVPGDYSSPTFPVDTIIDLSEYKGLGVGLLYYELHGQLFIRENGLVLMYDGDYGEPDFVGILELLIQIKNKYMEEKQNVQVESRIIDKAS